MKGELSGNNSRITISLKMEIRDFPGDPVVKNPPSNAGDAGSIPVWGAKVPRAAGQLSLRTAPKTQHSLINK